MFCVLSLILEKLNFVKRQMSDENNIVYTYSNVKDFDNNLTNSNSLEFRTRLLTNVNITKQCTDVKIVGDVVEVWFNGNLTEPEEEVLAQLVAEKYKDSNIFETIVDSRGRGQFSSIADAFAAGKTSVYVRDGTYYETQNIIIPDGGQLEGESQSNVRIVLVGNNTIKIDGSAGVKQTAGTISIAANSLIVTGVGTMFTALQPKDFIQLGTTYYEIGSIESDISLTLAQMYLGAPLVNVDYLAQHMYTGIKISNLIVALSSATGLYIRGVRHCGFKSLAIIGCTPNIVVVDSGEFAMYEIINCFSKGIGISFENVTSMLLQTLDIYNCAGHGMALLGKTTNAVCASSAFCNNFGCGLMLNDMLCDLHFTNCIFKQNNACGIFMQGNCMQVIVQGCTVGDNNGVGISISGSANLVSNNIIKNASHGVVTSPFCVVTSNQIDENKGNGIMCPEGSDNINISMNRISNNLINGVLSAAKFGLFSGNIVMNNGASGFEFSSSGNIINSSVISQNVEHGLLFLINSINNMVSNSQIISNTVSGATVQSNDNIVSHNVFRLNGVNLNVTGSNNETTTNKLIA